MKIMKTIKIILTWLRTKRSGVRIPSAVPLVASVVSLATSFFVSLQNLSRTHFAAPRFQTEAQRSGFGLVFGTDL